MTAQKSRFDVIGQITALRRYARSLTRSDVDSEDLVHDALVRAYEKRASFQNGRNLRTWLLSILHNVFIDGRRARQAESRRIERAAELREPFLPPVQYHQLRLAQVRCAFMDLPEEQRTALHLVAIEGLTFAEAAGVLDIPAGTLMSRLARARATLRAIEDGTAEKMSDGTTPRYLKIVRGSDGPSRPDLQAYVEDQLPVARRIEVETHLCHHPADAMRIISDLRVRDELRLALADMPRMASIGASDAARRLERGLERGRLFRRLRQAAAVVALIGVGWLAHVEFGPLGVSEVVASGMPPAYVTDAVRAHRTTLVRAGMRSQPEVPEYDPAEIRAATAIVIPALPEGWTVTDVQIFPSAFGPSVEMAIRTETFGTVSLFAVRPGVFDVVPATLAHQQDLTAAYWQVGDVAYALVARADSGELDRAATRLARSVY